MASYDRGREKTAVDYTGLKIGVAVSPVLLLFIYWGKQDMGLTVSIVLIAIAFSLKVHWKSRKHVWFWVIICLILTLHIPLFLVVKWPHGNIPGVLYGMPLAIADYLIISRALDLAQKLFSRHTPLIEKTDD